MLGYSLSKYLLLELPDLFAPIIDINLHLADI